MSRHTVFAAVAAVVLATRGLHAQEPAKPKELKTVDVFIASAMTTQDTAEKRSRLERALNPLQDVLAKYPTNAAVWLEAGEVWAQLHNYAAADSALKKAGSMYAGYADEIAQERLRAWSEAFNNGVAFMDAAANDTTALTRALVQLNNAELMYAGRPESKLNIAAIYLSRADLPNAEKWFRAAIQSTEGPDFAKLKPEEQAQWKRYAETSRIALANVIAQRGIDAFNSDNFTVAIQSFQNALAMNPQSRDHAYNLAESIFAQARKLEQMRDSLTSAKKLAEANALAPQIDTLYTNLEPIVTAVREKDPNNTDTYRMLMGSYRFRGAMTKDVARKAAMDKQVNALVAGYGALDFEITQMSVPTSSGDGVIHGTLANIKLPAGTPIKLHFTLLAYDGSVAGEADATVNAGAPKAGVNFDVPVKATRDVASWKYSVAK